MAEKGRPSRRRTRTLETRGRKVTIREDERSVDVRIDDVPVHVAKLGPNRYHSHVFMFRDFEDLDELLEAMVAEEGTLWLLNPPRPGEHPHHGEGHH